MTVLGAVTHEGDSFYYWTEETLTGEHAVAYLRSLKAEFGEKIVVLLDRAPYFYAKEVWDFVSNEEATEFVEDTSVEKVDGPSLKLWYFPPHAPKLNPVEGCWDQLEAWFNFKLVRDLSQLKELLKIAFSSINTPNICNYLCP